MVNPYSQTRSSPLQTMPSALKFSIVVPTRNRADCLLTALQSIKRQTYAGFEVIVIDDGSRACCRARYTEIWQLLDERFRLICVSPDDAPGIGPAAARNLGIAQASGEFLAFCDDDDYWCADDHLAVAAEALSATPDADIYYANQAAFRSGEVFNTERWPQLRDWLSKAPKVGNLDVCRLPHEAFLQPGGIAHLDISIVRRSLAEEIEGFWKQLRFEEDFDFYLRSIDRARVLLYRPSIVAHHRAPDIQSSDNASTALNQTERWLAQCMACEHIRVTARTRRVIKLARMTQGYTLRHLTMSLYKNNQYEAAVTAGTQALAILPGLRWLLFMVYLRMRAAISFLPRGLRRVTLRRSDFRRSRYRELGVR
jgi:cellulose synthase/poly-beta-1,6-N-acetylglucosamine synthase-like glycosyltransferase